MYFWEKICKIRREEEKNQFYLFFLFSRPRDRTSEVENRILEIIFREQVEIKGKRPPEKRCNVAYVILDDGGGSTVAVDVIVAVQNTRGRRGVGLPLAY